MTHRQVAEHIDLSPTSGGMLRDMVVDTVMSMYQMREGVRSSNLKT